MLRLGRMEGYALYWTLKGHTRTGKALLKGTLTLGTAWETPTGAPDTKRRPAKRINWAERAKENMVTKEVGFGVVG
eukprot:scaffold36777_cov199-Amphora_coffeaeformis.AAC.1